MGMVSCGTRLGILACLASLFSGFGTDNAGAYTERTLHTFCSERRCADGAQPGGELVADQSGNLYGTTFAGGTNGVGHGSYETRISFFSWWNFRLAVSSANIV